MAGVLQQTDTIQILLLNVKHLVTCIKLLLPLRKALLQICTNLLCYAKLMKSKFPLVTERKLNVHKTSWTSSERLMDAQFTPCVQGVVILRTCNISKQVHVQNQQQNRHKKVCNMFKVNNSDTRTTLTCGVFFTNCKHISYLFLVLLLLTLNS